MADALLRSATERHWVGASGRRYTAERMLMTEAADRGAHDAVGLAIARGTNRIAQQVARPSPRITPAWLAKAQGAGASEIHAIAVPAADAARVVTDLQVTR